MKDYFTDSEGKRSVKVVVVLKQINSLERIKDNE
jgi:hypothetical protein